MAIWTVLLRAVGTMVLLFGMGGGIFRLLAFNSVIYSAQDAYPFIMDILYSLAFTLLCFGAATALNVLRKLENRAARQTAVLRHLMQPSDKFPLAEAVQYTVRRDIAPHAPTGWQDFRPRPPEPERDSGYDQRLARRARYIPKDLGQTRPVPKPVHVREVEEPLRSKRDERAAAVRRAKWDVGSSSPPGYDERLRR